MSRGGCTTSPAGLSITDDILSFIDERRIPGFGFQVQGLDFWMDTSDPRSLGQLNGRFGGLRKKG